MPNTLEKENKKVETRVGPTLEKHGMNRNKPSMFHFKKKFQGHMIYLVLIHPLLFPLSLKCH